MPLFKDLKLHKVIFELRYDKGYLYFDVCGKTVKKIEEKMPDFKFRGIEGPNVAVLDDYKDRMVACFAWDKLDITQMYAENVNKFKSAAETFSKVVTESLGVDRFKRIGNRYQFMYKTNSIENASDIIKKAGVITKDWSTLDRLGGELDKASCTAILRRDAYFHRIVLTAVEKQEPVAIRTKPEEEYNPQFAVLVDIDVYQEDPKSFDVNDFIHKAYKMMEHNAIRLIS